MNTEDIQSSWQHTQEASIPAIISDSMQGSTSESNKQSHPDELSSGAAENERSEILNEALRHLN
jgi:hypothetical protein